MQKINWKNLRINILISIASVIIFLILIELGLRFVYTPTVPAYGYPEGVHIPDNVIGFKYKSNFEGKFRGNLYSNISLNINSKGLRDYEHEYKKSENTFRIAVLGDSVTVGAGVPFKDTYASQLEKKLNLFNNSLNYEIIKAGINSHDLEQYLLYFDDEIYKYDPDLVIIGLVINDLVPFDKKKVQQDMFGMGKRNIKQALENKCFLCNLIFRNIYHYLHLKGRGYNEVYAEKVYMLWDDEGEWKKSQSLLKNLINRSKKDGFNIVVVIFPLVQQLDNAEGTKWKTITPDNLGNLPQRKMIQFGKKNNITVLDLIPYLDVPNYRELYLYKDDVHLNSEGYDISSDAIIETLIKNNLITYKNVK